MSDQVLDTPPSKPTAVRVVYVAGTMQFGRPVKSGLGPTPPLDPAKALIDFGYYEVGEKITRLAPRMLESYGVKADAREMRTADLAGVTNRQLMGDYSGPKPIRRRSA